MLENVDFRFNAKLRVMRLDLSKKVLESNRDSSTIGLGFDCDKSNDELSWRVDRGVNASETCRLKLWEWFHLVILVKLFRHLEKTFVALNEIVRTVLLHRRIVQTSNATNWKGDSKFSWQQLLSRKCIVSLRSSNFTPAIQLKLIHCVAAIFDLYMNIHASILWLDAD